MKRRWPNLIHINGLTIVLIPKCASQSIRAALPIQPAHDAPDAYTVAFMRHPVSRALSAWYNLLQEGTVATPMMLKAGFRWGCTFRRFVDDLHRLRHRNKHTISQHEFLPGRVDRLFTVEAMPQAWRLLSGRFGLPDLPHLNTSPRIEAPAGLCDEIIDMYDVDYRLWRG